MIAYVQCRPDGEFTNVNCYAAAEGFRELGYEVRKFNVSEIPDLDLSRDTIVHGNIGTVWAAWDRIGVSRPQYLNFPEELMHFARRTMWRSNLGDIRSLKRVPVFIKPIDEGKAFTGHVVREFRDLIETAAFPDEFPILAQESVNMVSEWRLFVLKCDIIGIGHYKGDPLSFPDAGFMKSALSQYTNPIAAHSMDFAVLSDGHSALIELNDGYSLGHYGLPPIRYARMVEARWNQVCSTEQ
jgi:hypothetical protein